MDIENVIDIEVDASEAKEGLSAYEVYLKNGGTLSEEEWLESLKGDTGPTGPTGANGKDGKDGKSAYEIWLEAGNTGTEEDFLNSLKGDNQVRETVVSSGVDYAEIGSWDDDNTENEDRLYRFVTISDIPGEEIKLSTSTSQIVGTTNLKSNVGFLGNYNKGDEDDTTKAIVSILGVAPVKTNDTTIQVNDRVMSDDNGYAVKSSNNLGYRVISILENGLLNISLSPNTDLMQRIKTDVTGLSDNIGSLDSLSTEDKSSLVNAINETFANCNIIGEIIEDTDMTIKDSGIYRVLASDQVSLRIGATSNIVAKYYQPGDYLFWNKEDSYLITLNKAYSSAYNMLCPTIGSYFVKKSGDNYQGYYRDVVINNISTINESQTISGTKTFSTLPESSVIPTTDNQLTNKKYVDDAITAAITTSLEASY